MIHKSSVSGTTSVGYPSPSSTQHLSADPVRLVLRMSDFWLLAVGCWLVCLASRTFCLENTLRQATCQADRCSLPQVP